MNDKNALEMLTQTIGDKLVDSVIIGNRSSEGLVVLSGARKEGERWKIQVTSISGVKSLSTRVPSERMRRYGQKALRFLEKEEYISRVGTWQDPLNRSLGIQILLYSGRTIELVGDLVVEIIDGDFAEREYNVPDEVRLPKPSVEIGHSVSHPIPSPEVGEINQGGNEAVAEVAEDYSKTDEHFPLTEEGNITTDEIESHEKETIGGTFPYVETEKSESEPKLQSHVSHEDLGMTRTEDMLSKGSDFEKTRSEEYAVEQPVLEEPRIGKPNEGNKVFGEIRDGTDISEDDMAMQTGEDGLHSKAGLESVKGFEETQIQAINRPEEREVTSWEEPKDEKESKFKEVQFEQTSRESIIEEIDEKLKEVEDQVDKHFSKSGGRHKTPLRPEDLDFDRLRRRKPDDQ